MSDVTSVSVCRLVNQAFPFLLLLLDFDLGSTLKPGVMQSSPDESRFQRLERQKFSVWLLVHCRVEEEQSVGSPNLVFVTKYQVDCRDNRLWQFRMKRSGGVFIPCLLLFPCLTLPLSLPMSHFLLLLLAPPFLLHCVIQGLIPVLTFNIFLSTRWISENETLWANQGVCASLGCSLKYPTDESMRRQSIDTQSVAFSRKPICCLIDLSKDKTTLYFGGLSIWKAVNSVRSRERVDGKRELGCKERRKMHLLAHLGQGFLMIYRLVQGLVLLSATATCRMSWTLPLIIGLILFVCLLQQVADS